MQQLGNFSNARKRERASQSVSHNFFEKLLFVVKRQMNKDWARSVPAAAVIPTVQVVSTFIGSKTFVACLESLL